MSKEKAAENRDALLSTASRLFRAHGIDGVGVAQIAKEAGLTHGAVYAHFASKEALAAEALSYGSAGNMVETREWIGNRRVSFEELLGAYASTYMRDRVDSGCPMPALASEVGRKTCEVSVCFKRALEELTDMIQGTLEPSIPAHERWRLALAAAAAEIGALAVSRAVVKSDPTLANDILEVTRDALGAAHRMALARTKKPAP